MTELEAIEIKINEIFDDLEGIYIIPVDQTKLSETRAKIIGLLESVANYLNETYIPMTLWQKDHIVETINGLYWGWLHFAINSIKLAIADPATISPDNHYRDEIISLTYDALIKQISRVKELLK